MNARRITSIVLLAFLSSIGASCVIHSDGSGTNFVFASSREKAERRETLPLELAAGEALTVAIPYGDIEVRVSDSEAAHVDAHWRAGGEDKAMAEAVLARYELGLERGNGSLSVTSVGEPLEIKGLVSTKRIGASVDLVLVVPPGVKLVASSTSGNLSATGALGSCRLESSYGDLTAAGVRGETSLETASGNARVQDVEAASVVATSQYGDIAASNLQASNVRLETSSGNVKVREVAGDLSIKSSYGDLEIDGAGGNLEAVTSSGNVSLRAEGKARRRLVTSYGDVRVHGAAGELSASTSSGNVTVDDFDGSLNAESSYGDVEISARLSDLNAVTTSGNVGVRAAPGSEVSSRWSVASSYGDVRVALPSADFACQLEASASSGEVRCEGSSDGGKAKHKLARSLNGGGNPVEIRSASGDVHISFH
ncbi:MAG: DUF4097 family beta strand repeat-containing protein [Planctomycetota bacterium]